MDPKYWIPFFEKMERITFIKGDLIYEKGSPCSHFYVIRSGSVFFMSNEDPNS